jgi:hypothetical protein
MHHAKSCKESIGYLGYLRERLKQLQTKRSD